MHYDNEREAMNNQTATEARVKQLNGDIKTHLIDDAIDALGGKLPKRDASGEYILLNIPISRNESLEAIMKFPRQIICTKAEFESRKAERQNKPDWRGAPHWANWLSQDSDGVWCWYEPEPEVGDTAFKYPCQSLRFEMVHSVRKGEVFGKWQDTLEQRPEVTKGIQPHKPIAQVGKEAFDKFADSVCEKLFGPGALPAKAANPHKKITKEDLAKAGYIFCGDSFGFVQAKPEPAKAEQDWGLDPDDESGFDFEALANQFDNVDDANAVWALRDKLLQKKRKSPELSFHLANASKELQASAKLLEPESHLLQSITGVIGAIQAIREAV